MQKEEVLQAFSEQKAKCIAQYPTLTEDWSYFTLIQSAIDSYYSNTEGVSNAFTAIVRGAYSYIAKSQLKCANDDSLGISYSDELPSVDISSCWYTFSWLDDLAGKIVCSEVVGTDGTASSEPSDVQPALDDIITELGSARADESSGLEQLAETYWQGNSKNDLIALLENRGEVQTTPDKQSIVKLIYVNNGLLEQIKTNGLDVYIPTSLR